MEEANLHEAILNAINSIVKDKEEFADAFRYNVIRVLGSHSSGDSTSEYDKDIERLQKKVKLLIEENAANGGNLKAYEPEYKRISKQIEDLRLKKAQANNSNRAKKAQEYMSKVSFTVTEYDDCLVRRLIRHIKVINESKIEICFNSGIVIQQKIDCI